MSESLGARVWRWIGRPEAALFVLVMTTYAYFYQAGGWNQNSRFDLTRAIVEHGTSRIDAYHKNTGDKALRDGHHYCDKAPGVSWLAVPAYAAARTGGVASPDGGAYVTTVLAIGLPSAISVLALCALLAVLGVGLRARLAASAAYGLGTLALPYSTLLYGHQLSGAMTLGAFALLVRGGRDARWPALVGAGLLLGGSVAVEYPAALSAAAVAVYAALTVRPGRRLTWLVLGGALPALALAAYHATAFGGPLTLPYEFSTQKQRSMGFFMGLGVPDPGVLWQIVGSSYRGLLFSAPWLALAVPGAVRLWRVHRREAAVCLAIVILHLWLNASLVDWQGGWAMGPRYLVPCIPFLVVLAAGLALPARARASVVRAGWALAGAAVVLSAFLMLVGVAVKPEVPVDVKRPYGQFLLPRFGRGDLAVNTQSIDRKAPSRSERYAWNLGQRVGLDGLASLAPLGAAWAACGIWLVFALELRRSPSSATLDATP